MKLLMDETLVERLGGPDLLSSLRTIDVLVGET